MNKTEKLKKIIIERYGSIRNFSKVVDIPPTTLIGALDRGIGGMAIDRVIKICDTLNIDIKTFDPVENIDLIKTFDINEIKLLKSFKQLNDSGKEKVIDNIQDLIQIDKYIINNSEINEAKDKCGKQDKVKKLNLKEELAKLDPIETVAAHDDHWNKPGELERIKKDLSKMDDWDW
ncbi:hypothetical protein [Metaclostridioides mangenotii]|uniref:hypothetical protein n=1 Tax=Metaclostridioides mangenotii TaxID=1540 RepID=UPI0004639732|nr:hypothetical protein [Clostridioides mangenotii]